MIYFIDFHFDNCYTCAQYSCTTFRTDTFRSLNQRREEMAQSSQPSCPHCGTPLAPGQRFCSNCGASADPNFGKPTAMGSGVNNPQAPELPTELPVPPPPPEHYYAQPAQPTPAPNTFYPPQQGQAFPPQQGQSYPSQQGYQPAPVPTYAQPVKDSSKSVLGQLGCGVLVVILLIVGVCGGASYLVYRYVVSAASSTSSTTSTYNSTTTGNGYGTNGTPQAIPTTTTQVNAAVTYASVDVTIVNVQKASSFTNDTNLSSPYVVRLNIKEHNPSTGSVYMFYGDNFHLLLSDGTSIAAGSEHDSTGIGQDVTRSNWVDFPVTTNVDVSKLTLRIGGANEAQMDVLLTASPDVSKYQLKTIRPNSAFTYAGLNWTLTTVTSSLSAYGKQATTGMRYITVSLKANNPTQNSFYVFPNDYARLQAGTTTPPPSVNTFSSSIAAGTTGSTARITFLMPQC